MSAISFNDSVSPLSKTKPNNDQKDDFSDLKRVKKVGEQSMNLAKSSSQGSVKLGDINSKLQSDQDSTNSFATSLLPCSTKTEVLIPPSSYEIQQKSAQIQQQLTKRRELLSSLPRFQVNFENLQSRFLVDSLFGGIFRYQSSEMISKKRKAEPALFELKEHCIQNLTFDDEYLLEIYETLKNVGQDLFLALNNSNIKNLNLTVKELVKNCNAKGIFYIQSLFYLIGVFCLHDFQRECLEPFNKVFKNFPIESIPIQVMALNLNEKDINNRDDFSDLESLEELKLTNAKKLSAKQFNSFSLTTISKLHIEEGNLLDFDFSRLKYLKELTLKDVNNLSVELFNSIPKKYLKKVTIEYSGDYKKNQDNLDFSDFESIEDLEIIQSETLTVDQFNSLPKTHLKRLKLKGDVSHLDFSTLTALEELTVDCYKMHVKQVDSLPKQHLKKLYLDGDIRISEIDFSNFNSLEEIGLFSNEIPTFTTDPHPFTANQFNNFPHPELLKKINFSYFDLQHFNLSNLETIEDLNFQYGLNLTSEQFNAAPKEYLKRLNLSSSPLPFGLEGGYSTNVTGFNFSSLVKIEDLNLSKVGGLTADQFNSLPKEHLKRLDLSGIDITGFDFSSLVKIEDLNLSEVNGLTADQFNSLPKEYLKKLDLLGSQIGLTGVSSKNVTGFNFSNLNNIEDLNLSSVDGLTVNQFSSLPKESLSNLYLNSICVTDFDFSSLVGLEVLNVNFCNSFSSEQMISLPFLENIKDLSLSNNDILGFDFSLFVYLRNLNLRDVTNLTPEVFNTVPRTHLQEFSFNTIKSHEGFDFSGLRHVKGGIFMFLRYLQD
jgi:hypothetical protein